MFEFTHEMFGTLRTTEIDGNPWFVLADVCKALSVGNPAQAASYLDDDEKSQVKSNIISSEVAPGGRDPWVISESGLYSLILRSRKPEAKKFKRWVTHEVLPSLRRDGRYDMSEHDAPAWARELMASVDALADKARALDAVHETSGGLSLAIVARRMGIGHHRLCQILREEGLTRNPGSVPTRRGRDSGLVVRRENVSMVPEEAYEDLARLVMTHILQNGENVHA